MTSIISAAPAELHATGGGWRPFLDTRTHTFYGWCDIDEGCGNPWSLHLPTGRLVQCGCPDFRVDPNSIEVDSIRTQLDRIDLTPIPRPVAWRYFDQCDDFHGCGHRGGWYFEAITRSVTPCPCGWDPTRLHEWETDQ